MNKNRVLKYLFISTFTSALVLSYLTVQPTTRAFHTQSIFDYCILIGLWTITFCAIFTVYKQTEKIKIKQILNAITAGLSSTSIATLILGVYPEFTGQRIAHSEDMTYSLPILITTTIMFAWINTQAEKTNPKTKTNT